MQIMKLIPNDISAILGGGAAASVEGGYGWQVRWGRRRPHFHVRFKRG